jgi:hypothetical protein
MGEVMTSVDQLARLRSLKIIALQMRQRRSIVRRARWCNSYANLKKIIAKNSHWILVVTFTFFVGLAVATDWSQLVSNLSRVLAPYANAIAELVPKPAQDHPTDSVAHKIESFISTPVTASGDETFPSLKLSTDLFLNKPPESNKP